MRSGAVLRELQACAEKIDAWRGAIRGPSISVVLLSARPGDRPARVYRGNGADATCIQAENTFVVDSTYAINMATGRTVPTQRRKSANLGLVTKLRDAYRDLTQKRGEEVRIEHVKSHTGVRGNEAADKLAALGAQIQDGHRIVERNSREPQMLDAEYKDNG